MDENNSKRFWTILIYANGNNELEPEIYHNFRQVLDEDVKGNINIVIQLARAPRYLVNTLRPGVGTKTSDIWHGVRRYIKSSQVQAQVNNLGNVNMASPCSLIDFLTWGVSNYAADNYMLILSGHGAGFVGAMTDLTWSYPYIMGIKGISEAINKSYEITGDKITAMVLDSCHMNMIEVWHEFAMMPDNPIEYLIAPSKNVPLEGLPIHLIIRQLQNALNTLQNPKDILSYIINSLNREVDTSNLLLAIDLLDENFIHLKESINNLAKVIISKNIDIILEIKAFYGGHNGEHSISLLDLNSLVQARYPHIHAMEKDILGQLKTIIFAPEVDSLPSKINIGPSLYLPSNLQQYMALRVYYDNLLFAENNYWLQLLRQNKDMEESNVEMEISNLKSPMPIPLEYVVISILEQNPNINEEKSWEIVRSLGWY